MYMMCILHVICITHVIHLLHADTFDTLKRVDSIIMVKLPILFD